MRAGKGYLNYKMGLTSDDFNKKIERIGKKNCICVICFDPFQGYNSQKYCENCSVNNKNHPKKGRGYSRHFVRVRDKFTCQDCGLVRTIQEIEEHNRDIVGLKGRIKSLDVHHINGMCGKNSIGYDSVKDLSGMITLCHKCHYNRPEHRVHTKEFRDKFRKGYVKK